MCLARKTIKTIFLILNCDKLNSHYIFETQKIVNETCQLSLSKKKRRKDIDRVSTLKVRAKSISLKISMSYCTCYTCFRIKFSTSQILLLSCLPQRQTRSLRTIQVKSYFCPSFVYGRRVLSLWINFFLENGK